MLVPANRGPTWIWVNAFFQRFCRVCGLRLRPSGGETTEVSEHTLADMLLKQAHV